MSVVLSGVLLALSSAAAFTPPPLPAHLSAQSVSGKGQPLLVALTEEEVLTSTKEMDRQQATAFSAVLEVRGEQLVVRSTVQDTCTTRQTDEVLVKTILDVAPGQERLRTRRVWLGMGSMVLAGYAAVADYSGTPDEDVFVTRALYTGTFGALGATALSRAWQQRRRVVDEQTISRTLVVQEKPCEASEQGGHPIELGAKLGSRYVSWIEDHREPSPLLSGTTADDGTMHGLISDIQTMLVPLLETEHPSQDIVLTVSVAGLPHQSITVPEQLAAPAREAQALHAEERAREAFAAGYADMKLARRGTSGRHFSGILRDADRNFNTALHWSTTTELRHAISEAKEEFEETKRVLEKAQSEAQRAYYAAEHAREMREARARWRTIERRSFATCQRLLSELSRIESRYESLYYSDRGAAEAYLTENRSRINDVTDELNKARMNVVGVRKEMQHYGEYEQARAFNTRIGENCSR